MTARARRQPQPQPPQPPQPQQRPGVFELVHKIVIFLLGVIELFEIVLQPIRDALEQWLDGPNSSSRAAASNDEAAAAPVEPVAAVAAVAVEPADNGLLSAADILPQADNLLQANAHDLGPWADDQGFASWADDHDFAPRADDSDESEDDVRLGPNDRGFGFGFNSAPIYR